MVSEGTGFEVMERWDTVWSAFVHNVYENLLFSYAITCQAFVFELKLLFVIKGGITFVAVEA